MVRRKKEEALATRDLILDTAECVFQRLGVAATSLQEIAQAAGLTRGAIYWHFQNKADVFEAMMQRVALPLERTLEADDMLAAADPLEFLRRAMDNVLAQLVHDPQVQRVFEIATLKVAYVGDLQVLREQRIASRDGCMEDLQRVFSLAAAQGQIGRAPPPKVAAAGLFALMDGLLYNWLLDPKAFDLQSIGRHSLNIYLRGLATGGTSTASAVKMRTRATAH